MRYPPAISIVPSASKVYRFFSFAVSIVLMALSASLIQTSGELGLKHGFFLGLCALAVLGVIHDAWAAPKASVSKLHYAQGCWSLEQEGRVSEGTLQLRLDLQSYLLLGFVPAVTRPPFFLRTTQWFHLEACQPEFAGSPLRWQALRRAVFASADGGHEQGAT
jgi:hypothetical protein